MILSLKDFQKGMYVLPHPERAPNEADNTDLICSYIERYERELLEETLGVDVYNEIVNSSDNFSGADDKIKNLVLGTIYELSDKKVKWGGLKNMLVPYIYYRFLQDQTEIFGTFGIERTKGVNSDAVSSIAKATRAHRDFFNKYQGEDDFFRVVNNSQFVGLDYSGNTKVNRSLYQFLCDNSDTYEVSDFQFIEDINQFGV